MRIVWLVIIGLVSYLIGMLVFFPAAPVVDKIRPQLGPVVLQGVSGKLYKGNISNVFSTDDLLPLQFKNVGWTLAPGTLLRGGTGATFRFEGYGGDGEGVAARQLNGDIRISDLTFDAQAKELEALLPVPLASFNGTLSGDIEKLVLVDQLLTHLEGELIWSNAMLETPVPTRLGEVRVDIEPGDQGSHTVTLNAAGGDVAMDGSVSLTAGGDFSADVLFTPSADAPPDVLSGLRQMGRPDNQGRVRFVRQGNVNRLM